MHVILGISALLTMLIGGVMLAQGYIEESPTELVFGAVLFILAALIVIVH